MNIMTANIRSLALVLVCLCISHAGKAQESLPISLEAALEMGGAQNLTLMEYKQRQALAYAGLAQSKEWWLPDIYTGLQTHQLWGAVMNGNGNFFLDVRRQNLWAGLGLDASWDFTDGIYNSKVAKLQLQAAEYQTKAKRNEALLEIIQVYYDLLAAQLSVEAYQQLAQQSDTIALQLGVQVDAGLAYESEYLLAKINANHLKVQMLHARAEHGRRSGELARLLNLPAGQVLVSVDSLMAPLDMIKDTSSTMDFGAIYARRPELKANELWTQAVEMEKKSLQAGLLIPQLRLNTYGSYYGRIIGPVTPMAPALYPETRQLYPTGALNVSLMWNIPLGRLIYNGEIKSYTARILLKQIEKDGQIAEINKDLMVSQQALAAAREQMEIAGESNELAARALRQSIQRQQLGTVRPFEILQAQEFFINARLDHLRSVASYNKAQYALWVASGGEL